jgi:hypothetical protein
MSSTAQSRSKDSPFNTYSTPCCIVDLRKAEELGKKLAKLDVVIGIWLGWREWPEGEGGDGGGEGGIMNIDVPPLGSPTHQFWQRTLIRS